MYRYVHFHYMTTEWPIQPGKQALQRIIMKKVPIWSKWGFYDCPNYFYIVVGAGWLDRCILWVLIMSEGEFLSLCTKAFTKKEIYLLHIFEFCLLICYCTSNLKGLTTWLYKLAQKSWGVNKFAVQPSDFVEI